MAFNIGTLVPRVPYCATKTHAYIFGLEFGNLTRPSVVTRQTPWNGAATLNSWSSARMLMKTCGVVEPIGDKN